ncbi:hypothetical protein RRG08_051971 [Elysia crispata]|uniref:Uncharacterized protein n=1 Tax=Elysia crispata TaxID=231223 RepID=A0AAE0ZDN9_9GAST|nr:hypothetical protein RRG08_051971 [Elysia crispata]
MGRQFCKEEYRILWSRSRGGRGVRGGIFRSPEPPLDLLNGSLITPITVTNRGHVGPGMSANKDSDLPMGSSRDLGDFETSGVKEKSLKTPNSSQGRRLMGKMEGLRRMKRETNCCHYLLDFWENHQQRQHRNHQQNEGTITEGLGIPTIGASAVSPSGSRDLPWIYQTASQPVTTDLDSDKVRFGKSTTSIAIGRYSLPGQTSRLQFGRADNGFTCPEPHASQSHLEEVGAESTAQSPRVDNELDKRLGPRGVNCPQLVLLGTPAGCQAPLNRRSNCVESWGIYSAPPVMGTDWRGVIKSAQSGRHLHTCF